MKTFLTLGCFIISLIGQGQTFDFGIEFKTNSNRLSNRYDTSEGISTPQHTTNELGSFEIPEYNFAFLDDQNELVYARFNEVKMDNNIVLPLYLKYTTKNGFSYDLRMSTGKYRLEYQGEIFRDAEYYSFYNASFEEYKELYGGLFDGFSVNGTDELYTDEQAYINWFDGRANSDAYSQASIFLVEEIKFKSFHFWAGKKFYEHKRIQPFVNLGLHYRRAEASFRRKHFEIDDNFLGQVLTKSDLSELSEQIPSFSSQTIGMGIRLGFDLYRYHFAVSSEYSFNLNAEFQDKPLVYSYINAGAGFRTISLALGVDLFSHDLRSKDYREIVYNDEFQSLSSKLDKNRSSYTVVNVKAPIVSRMNHDKEFTLLTVIDELKPEDLAFNLDWQSLSFKEITRVNWSPKIEVGKRFNIVKPLDIEILGAFSILNIDRKVQEVNTRIYYDTIDLIDRYDLFATDINYAVFRSTFIPIQMGVNLYLNVLSTETFDLKLYGGAGINWFALVTPGPTSEFGVNGEGNDIYQTTEDLLFYGGYEPASIYNADVTWYSGYAEDFDLETSVENHIINVFGDEDLEPLLDYASEGSGGFNQKVLYGTMNFGIEFEFNRFLAGASAELSIGNVDNFLVKDYSNLNLNLGYIIQTKNRYNKKLRD
ncbi:MAG: hypothetical protein AB8B74_04545 [Crocinitomicaceae bacterium]